MTYPMDENAVLTQSIGEHAVDAIGKDRLAALSVLLDPRDSSCVVSVALSDNSSEEQLRAVEKLLDLQLLFADEVLMHFDLTEHVSDESDQHTQSQLQYSFA